MEYEKFLDKISACSLDGVFKKFGWNVTNG